MDSIAKNLMFYITIVKDNKADHSFLRNVIHRVLPQALVDSVCSGEEAISYFSNCTTIPHLIFLDQDMLEVAGRDTIGLIKRVEGLDKVPIIFLTHSDNESQKLEFIKQGISNFYSKPYQAEDLLNIMSSVNRKWVA